MKSFFTTHPLMKLISLALALLLWFFVRGERRTEVSVDVKVQVKNLSDKFVISGELEPTINLHLVGPRTRLARIDEGYFKAYDIDLTNVRKGTNSFWVHDEDFKVPRGVQVTRIVPQVIRLTIDEAEEKLVRIEPNFIDTLDEGFELASFEVVPPYTKKRGSRRELANTGFVFTEPISLAGRRASFSGEVGLSSHDYNGSEEQKIVVKVSIREKEISRIFKDIPVRVVGLKSAVKIEPKTISIKALGPAGKVAALADERLELTIDANQMGLAKRKQKTFKVRPLPPKRPGIEMTVIPAIVQVTLLAD